MKYTVSYTIKKNKSGVPSGRYSKKFMTKYGAHKFMVDLLYSKKRIWYKYVNNIKSNA